MYVCLSVLAAWYQSQQGGLERARLSATAFQQSITTRREGGTRCDPESLSWSSSSTSLTWCVLGAEWSQDVTLLSHLPCSPTPTQLQILSEPYKPTGGAMSRGGAGQSHVLHLGERADFLALSLRALCPCQRLPPASGPVGLGELPRS